ncbi:unnamed protein product [Lupinus luteus]|uniref:Uncharacterized protein n=1 Tax=Lupinus luteus TaxID=3873 RepID=A0AAV1X756_LUPLU
MEKRDIKTFFVSKTAILGCVGIEEAENEFCSCCEDDDYVSKEALVEDLKDELDDDLILTRTVKSIVVTHNKLMSWRVEFDLVITAKGTKEKIASGLLQPFLSHLNAAKDQMAKGGYSIILEVDGRGDATRFTKGTVERFVCFVNTPEILERVYTIESESLQIEETIAIQGNSSWGVGSPNAEPPEAKGSLNRVHDLKVLETRKSVLQKEQGMAFTHAVAASFDIDHIAALMSFSECFKHFG